MMALKLEIQEARKVVKHHNLVGLRESAFVLMVLKFDFVYSLFSFVVIFGLIFVIIFYLLGEGWGLDE